MHALEQAELASWFCVPGDTHAKTATPSPVQPRIDDNSQLASVGLRTASSAVTGLTAYASATLSGNDFSCASVEAQGNNEPACGTRNVPKQNSQHTADNAESLRVVHGASTTATPLGVPGAGDHPSFPGSPPRQLGSISPVSCAVDQQSLSSTLGARLAECLNAQGAASDRTVVFVPIQEVQLLPFPNGIPPEVEGVVSAKGVELTQLPEDFKALESSQESGSTSARTPYSASNRTPIRFHAEWSESGVRVWLGVDAEASRYVEHLIGQIQSWLEQQGTQLVALVCNGCATPHQRSIRQVYDERDLPDGEGLSLSTQLGGNGLLENAHSGQPQQKLYTVLQSTPQEIS